MGSKRLDSLGDFHRQGYRLRVDCLSCNRVAILAPLPLLQRCHAEGASHQLGAVKRRLRCSSCGGRKVRLGPAFGN